MTDMGGFVGINVDALQCRIFVTRILLNDSGELIFKSFRFQAGCQAGSRREEGFHKLRLAISAERGSQLFVYLDGGGTVETHAAEEDSDYATDGRPTYEVEDVAWSKGGSRPG